MKTVFILIILFLSAFCSAQQNTYCYVTSVRGKVHYPDNRIVKPGEKVMFNDIKRLVPQDSTCFVTFYHPTEGSFGNTMQKSQDKKKQSFTLFVSELVKGREVSVSLSSRSGDCACKEMAECINVDPAINSKLLLFDTLLLPVLGQTPDTDSCFYFFQWKNESNIYNTRLVTRQGSLVITANDLVFDGIRYPENGTSPVTLGLCKIYQGKRRYEIISRIQFQIIEPDILRRYYQSLQQAIPGTDKLFDRFYVDVYAFFGKPSICSLKKIIN